MKPLAGPTVRLVLALLLSGGITPAVEAQTAPAAAVESSSAQAPRPVALPDEVPPDRRPTAAQQDSSLPVDIEHIKQEAGKQSAMKLDDQQLRFYVLILAKQPKFSFTEVVGGYDLMNGPTRGGAAMTHKEFLNMVTPKELNELFGSTSSSSFAMFQAALMNAAGQMIIKKAIQQLRNAHDERDVQEIRQRIDTELRELDGRDQ